MQLGSRYNQHSFAQVPSVNIQRSSLDRSSAAKTTFKFDELVPCFIDEILPGDSINLNVKTFARLEAQVVPLMDNMYIDYHFFFVPNRLVWNNWERLMGAQDDPGDSTDFLVPVVTANALDNKVMELGDQMGIPIQQNVTVNALPFRAYNLIWNTWFRDQNLQNSVLVPKDDGPDTWATYKLLKRAKKHDYFTSALPWPQKGDAVSLPLQGTAPVTTNNSIVQMYTLGNSPQNLSYNGTTNAIQLATPQTASAGARFGTITGLQADLSAATAATINVLRQAFMMQSLLELDARGGTRYTEILKAHFNVVSPDFRLQRPEFLGAATTRIQQHPVAQTSETTTESPQANLSAFSTAAELGSKIGFTKSFVEHGFVIGLMSARADITYQQGINKMWTRRTRWDYFWPKLQELGEQAILNKEIYYDTTDSKNDDVFGYQERYAEYKYKPSEIRGMFRSQYAQSLDVWHLGQYFVSRPVLNDEFIESDTPIGRALVNNAITDPHIKMDMFFEQKHARPMMTYAVPASLGRF